MVAQIAWFDELIDEADEIHNNSFMTQDGVKKDSANFDSNSNHVGAGVPEGGQFTFAAGSKGALTKEAASKKFPDEKWEKKAKGVYAASSRGKDKNGNINKSEQEKLNKEVEQAKILAKEGHIVFLTPESGEHHVRQFDGFIDGENTIDLKKVEGKSENAIGRNLSNGVQKAENVFIQTSGRTAKEVYSKCLGKTKVLLKDYVEIKAANGTIFVWIDEEAKLHKWTMKEIIDKARNML